MTKKRLIENGAMTILDDSFLQNVHQSERLAAQKPCLVKSESSPGLYNTGRQYPDNYYENMEDKSYRGGGGKKPGTKVTITTSTNEGDDLRICGTLRLSHIVIVDSVLKETNMDPDVDALLPPHLNILYKKFLNDKKYLEQWQAKDEFYRGVGLFGIGVEERILNKRKALEDSLKKCVRLRPNPKPRKQFDGTVINRPLKNKYNFKTTTSGGGNKTKETPDKVKCNIFTIGNDLTKKSGNRAQIRKSLKRKSVVRRAAAQKLELAKKALNEAYGSTDDDADVDEGDGESERKKDVSVAAKSIALSRAKRKTKVPQLDFKYCYNDTFGGGGRQRKYAGANKEDQFMEIIDSDSSSVVEVFPPGDKENSEYSDGGGGCGQKRTCKFEKDFSSKYVIGTRKEWRPRENKALNLLDKLRLGLQCTVIQTETDVIIQNLTVEDLSTLRRRLQGLAPFKNIEAEYDKNGIETARATIDRRVLNLPSKGGGGDYESQSDSPRFPGTNTNNNNNITTKKGGTIEEVALRRRLAEKRKTPEKETTNVVPSTDRNLSCYKTEEQYCSSASSWVRPKVRSVKKIRKLYTQSASTPNILARSHNSVRADVVGGSGRQNVSSSSGSLTDVLSNPAQHVSSTPVSFYPLITSSNLSTESHDTKAIKSESFLTSCPFSSSSIMDPPSCSSSLPSSTPLFSDSIISTTTVCSLSSTLSDSSRRLAPSFSSSSASFCPSSSSNGTPATAMSASQLLMMRKGCAQTNSSGDPSSPSTSTISMSRNDQLFASQILQPFKKAVPASSPSKLEIDDEEADFELTPSILAQARTVDAVVSLSSCPVIVHNKAPVSSKPLIQPAGVLSGPRRTIHITHSSQFPTLGTGVIATSLLTSRLGLTHKTPPVTVEATPSSVLAPPSSLPYVMDPSSTSSSSSLRTSVIVSNPSSKVITGTPSSLVPPSLGVVQSPLKIKHRKWTHNFLTSNSVNFREVLCAAPLSRAPFSSVGPLLRPQPTHLGPGTCPVTFKYLDRVPAPSPGPGSLPAPPCTVPLTSCALNVGPTLGSMVPSKGSSVVLKSLLVGSNSGDDLCCPLNKSAIWASKYLVSNSGGAGKDSSKIKWQVGGSVVTSPSSSLVTSVSKENKSLDSLGPPSQHPHPPDSN